MSTSNIKISSVSVTTAYQSVPCVKAVAATPGGSLISAGSAMAGVGRPKSLNLMTKRTQTSMNPAMKVHERTTTRIFSHFNVAAS